MDLFTRTVVGLRMLTVHTVALTLGALQDALRDGRKPNILHSDQGSEYSARRYTRFAEAFGIRLSMSRKSSPWENGYQESFYSQFKVDRIGNDERAANPPRWFRSDVFRVSDADVLIGASVGKISHEPQSQNTWKCWDCRISQDE